MYLLRQELSEDEDEAHQIVHRSKAFTVIKGQLYRESVTGVAQRCVTPEEGRMILNDIHSGTCGHHASSRTIMAKACRAGFYWPRANEMAKDIVDKCAGCQFYSNMSHKPESALEDYSTRLAICRLGVGYGWTLENRQKWFHSPACWSRQVH